jgi:dsRNA-specific ribonuclease
MNAHYLKIGELCHTSRRPAKTHINKETSMSAVPESFLGAAANDADAQETREWLDALPA